MESLQTRLSDEHSARRGELEQLRLEVAAERTRLHVEIEQLDGRIGKLAESVRSLESGLDKRLGQMAGDTVKNMRNEIEGIADAMLQDVTARTAQALGTQMDETAGNMRTVQEGVAASVSALLKARSADAVQDFEHSMDELGQRSIDHWRQKLASGLNALAKNLGEHFS
jgi:chromosome segregation ATPase